MDAVEKEFSTLPASISVVSIYELKRPEVKPIDVNETRARRPSEGGDSNQRGDRLSLLAVGNALRLH